MKRLIDLSISDLDTLSKDLWNKLYRDTKATLADQKRYDAIIKEWCKRRDEIDYGIEITEEDKELLHKTSWTEIKQ